MDITLIISIVLLLLALVGCFVPVIPGQVLAYGALLVRHIFSNEVHYSLTILVVLAVVLVVVTVADYIVPSWITRKGGGSKYGARGALIGMIAGMVFTPIGMLLGMFAGAFIGEMMHQNNAGKALGVACYSFLGFLLTVGIKVIYCIIAGYFVFFP
ncbi:membrane protein [Bacteroidia bacterium]|nr:membrane protein [Bacteroidia bacterium]GHT80705.1 membrane protein [Bacteroidia bacterium]